MCAVSATMDYFRTNVPVTSWTPDTWGQFQQVLRKLEDLDAKLDQRDCHDPAKAAWMKAVEDRLAALEA